VSRVYLVIIVVIVFLLILSLTSLNLRLRCRRQGKDDQFALEFSIWRGLFFYRLEIPVVELKTKREKPNPEPQPRHRPSFWPVPRPVLKIRSEVEGKGGRPFTEDQRRIPVPGPVKLVLDLYSTVRFVKRYKLAILFLLRRVHLRRLYWETELGTGDPSQTGFLTGVAWGVKGFLLTVAYRLLSPGGARPKVVVTPSFEKACFNTVLDCLLGVRIGYVILAGFKALIIKLKVKADGWNGCARHHPSDEKH